MSIVSEIDKMISDLNKMKQKPEYVIMGRNFFYKWIVEITREGDLSLAPSKKVHKYTHKNIPVIISYSDILEVVPNAKFMLD